MDASAHDVVAEFPEVRLNHRLVQCVEGGLRDRATPLTWLPIPRSRSKLAPGLSGIQWVLRKVSFPVDRDVLLPKRHQSGTDLIVPLCDGRVLRSVLYV